MITIHKFPLPLRDTLTVHVPRGAELLDIQFQHNILCAWYLLDPDAQVEARRLRVYGTGRAVEDPRETLAYRRSLQHGAYVWHIFEVEKEEEEEE